MVFPSHDLSHVTSTLLSFSSPETGPLQHKIRLLSFFFSMSSCIIVYTFDQGFVYSKSRCHHTEVSCQPTVVTV